MEGILEVPLNVWHAHRLELLLLAGILLVATRIAVSRARSKQGPNQKAAPVYDGDLHIRVGTKDREVPLARFDGSEKPAPPLRIKSDGPKRIAGMRRTKSSAYDKSLDTSASQMRIRPVVFYYSLGGSTAKYAELLSTNLRFTTQAEIFDTPEVYDLADIDFDSHFVSSPRLPSGTQAFYLFLLPTYNIDSELDTFIQSLSETHNDFRIDTAPLQTLAGYSVFGFGDREGWPTEQDGFCSQALEVDKWMARLTGARRAYPIGMGDMRSDVKRTLQTWSEGVLEVCLGIASGRGLGEGVIGSGDAVESGEEDSAAESEAEPSVARTSKKRKRRGTPATDLEDIRAPDPSSLDLETDFTSAPKTSLHSAPKEMVPKSSTTYNALTKQGYTIVGTHSGVKTCRWTKSALRGRGSCYKYSFYGIASHRCMEATPSLSCSNKCVFCWRHGTNPVSTTWRWTVDPADLVFAGIKAGHYSKIKQLRGVPGVRAERFTEAMQIRHCALSLVGEPIFYPHINELLRMLHAERISTFLVCNAQHPDQLRALDKVTQLYVSIDAPTKDRLKKVDRPLHRDFWERFLECMDILRERRYEQRTVFRLTLVKGFNLDDEEQKEAMREDVRGYADLIERAEPGFVEIKGVTYCGTSTSASAGLTMRNVPFYEEVCSFVEALDQELEKRGLGYGIAAEHAHSCCILMAEKKRFYKDDGWHTLIDYGTFFDKLEAGGDFGPEDYVGEQTPEWALYGNGGFDPRDQRVDRKGRPRE